MRFGAILAALALSAAGIAAGCETQSQEHAFTSSQLTGIIDVRPTTPGWDWPPEPTVGPTHTRNEPNSSSRVGPVQARLDRKLEAAGFIQSEEREWQAGTRTGATFAAVFDTDSGARDAISAYREFSHSWPSVIGNTKRTDEPADGLGEEAWAMRDAEPEPGAAESMAYVWRRRNLVLSVHIRCSDSCPSNIALALRDWADAVDEAVPPGQS